MKLIKKLNRAYQSYQILHYKFYIFFVEILCFNVEFWKYTSPISGVFQKPKMQDFIIKFYIKFYIFSRTTFYSSELLIISHKLIHFLFPSFRPLTYLQLNHDHPFLKLLLSDNQFKMPRISSQKKIQKTLNLLEFILLLDPDPNSKSNAENDLLHLTSLLHNRYQVPRSYIFHTPLYKLQKLHQLPESSFQQLFQTSLAHFITLLAMN